MRHAVPPALTSHRLHLLIGLPRQSWGGRHTLTGSRAAGEVAFDFPTGRATCDPPPPWSPAAKASSGTDPPSVAVEGEEEALRGGGPAADVPRTL